MAAGDLTTYDLVKAWCGLPAGNTADDALFTRLVTAASSAAQLYMGRNIPSASYVEAYNGNSRQALLLRQSPIVSITSVTVDNTTIPQATAQPGAGWRFDTMFLYLDGYGFNRSDGGGTSSFNRGIQNVVVTYTAGYATVPFDIAQATIEMAGYLYKSKDRIGEASKLVAGQTIAYIRDINPNTLRTLDQYKRTVGVVGVR